MWWFPIWSRNSFPVTSWLCWCLQPMTLSIGKIKKKCLDVLSSVESVTLSWFLSPWEMCLSPCFPSLIRTLSTVTFSLMRQTISESVRSSKISTNIFSFTFVLHNRVTELHTLGTSFRKQNITISEYHLLDWYSGNEKWRLIISMNNIFYLPQERMIKRFCSRFSLPSLGVFLTNSNTRKCKIKK